MVSKSHDHMFALLVLVGSSALLVGSPARCATRTSAARLDLVLTEENAAAVLDECQSTLSAVFGNNAEAAAVGITGAAEFVELDGPSVVVRLRGRFWHKRSTVLERIESYLLERIPECVSVEIEDPAQLDDAVLPEDSL